MPGGVLKGVRVLDFGRYIAAPFCSALLADLGAEVIRIEGIEGNDDRFVMPVTETEGALFLQVNRNKASLPIDMRHPKAPELIRRLVAASDVVVCNMVPKALARLGLDYPSLSAIRPDIILTNVTAFGAEGPERNSLGFDGTGQAMSGALYLSGLPGQPYRAAVSYVDYGTAFASAFGTLAALLDRDRTGHGQEVKASLLGTALTMMNPILIEQASGRRVRVATGNRSPIAGPSDVFATRDGFVMVQVIGQDMFRRWLGLVGAADLEDDPRFADDIGRGENGAILSERMGAWCRDKTTEECLAALRAARIPGCPVLSPGQALDQSQVEQGGLLEWVDVEGLEQPVPLAVPIRLSRNEIGEIAPAPFLGKGIRPILNRIGFTDAEIQDLEAARVISLAGDDEASAVLAGAGAT
ncbi:CoA transferase [Micromonospora sp. STR1s_5]|nr:CoA transferase [Micromonospora sp. STR1s_5]